MRSAMAHERTIWINKDSYGGVEIYPGYKLENEIEDNGLEIKTAYINSGGEYHEFAEQMRSYDLDLDEIPRHCMTRALIGDEHAWCLFGIEF